MPSTLIGGQSGGVPLISGNPYAGRFPPMTGITIQSAFSSSGRVYLSFSGGVTITSGDGVAGGGMLDGMELNPSQRVDLPLPPGGPAGIFVTTPSAASGFVRLFWAGRGAAGY